jgi:hypothetical protein
MEEDAVDVFPDCLYSKWGFKDGDLLREWSGRWHHDLRRPGVDQHLVLVRLVREYVLPKLDQRVEVVVEQGTVHNPIRAASVNGHAVDDDVIYGDKAPPIALTPEWFSFPFSLVDRVAEEILASIPQDPPPSRV